MSSGAEPERFARVLLVAEPMFRHFYSDLAVELKRRFGSWVHLVCASPEQVSFYEGQNRDGRFDRISHLGGVADAFSAVADPASVVARAQAWEKRIDCTINTLAVINRHYGRGYSPGGYNMPMSRQMETIGYTEMLNGIVATLDYWDRLVSEDATTLCIGGNKFCAVVMRSKGLPYRNLVSTRFGNGYFWAESEFNESREIKAAYDALSDRDVPPVVLDRSYLTAEKDRPVFLKRRNPLWLARIMAKQVANHIYWRLRRSRKAGNYYLSSELRYFLDQWRALRRWTSGRFRQLADFAGQDFVFLPMATEPETTLSVLSPEYLSQHMAAVDVSRNLPAGVLLAVKESLYSLGRRPRDFERQIAALRNVTFVEMTVAGLDLVKASRAVVTISGTPGFEAAVLGKPVISFGLHNPFGFLGHVRTIRRQGDLAAAISDIFGNGIDLDRARRDGARFHAALRSVAVDMHDFTYMNLSGYSTGSVSQAADALQRSIAQ